MNNSKYIPDPEQLCRCGLPHYESEKSDCCLCDCHQMHRFMIENFVKELAKHDGNIHETVNAMNKQKELLK